jgi:hypothetical protein
MVWTPTDSRVTTSVAPNPSKRSTLEAHATACAQIRAVRSGRDRLQRHRLRGTHDSSGRPAARSSVGRAFVASVILELGTETLRRRRERYATPSLDRLLSPKE